MRILAGLLIFGALGAAAWGGWRPRAPKRSSTDPAQALVVQAVARKQDLLITVNRTGALATKDRTSVMPEISGRLIWVCEDATMVAVGDRIALLDPKSTQENLVQLQAQYDDAVTGLARAQERSRSTLAEGRIRLRSLNEDVASYERQQQATLRQLADSIAFQEKELAQRSKEADVKRRLAAQGLIAATEVEQAEADIGAAEFALQRDRTDYELQKSQSASLVQERKQKVADAEEDFRHDQRHGERNVRMGRNQVENLKLRLQRARDDLQKTTIVAPTAGLVVLSSWGWRGEQHTPRPGDGVTAGRQLAEIVSLSHMRVALELDQSQITDVRLGQTALVEVEAIPGRSFTGRVIAIGRTARRSPLDQWRGVSNETTFPVTIDLGKSTNSLMRPGMVANVRIIVRRVPGATVVPSECIFDRGGGHIVFVQRGERYQRTRVEVGESDGDYTAVTQGLRPGDRVALNDLDAVPAAAASTPTAPAHGGRQ